jgi:hypothetical protein
MNRIRTIRIPASGRTVQSEFSEAFSLAPVPCSEAPESWAGSSERPTALRLRECKRFLAN